MANANVNITVSKNRTSMLFSDHLLAHGIRIHDYHYAFVASTEANEPAHALETKPCSTYITFATSTET